MGPASSVRRTTVGPRHVRSPCVGCAPPSLVPKKAKQSKARRKLLNEGNWHTPVERESGSEKEYLLCSLSHRNPETAHSLLLLGPRFVRESRFLLFLSLFPLSRFSFFVSHHRQPRSCLKRNDDALFLAAVKNFWALQARPWRVSIEFSATLTPLSSSRNSSARRVWISLSSLTSSSNCVDWTRWYRSCHWMSRHVG